VSVQSRYRHSRKITSYAERRTLRACEVTRLKEENVSGGGDGVNQKEEQRLCLFTVGVRQHTAAACVRRVEVYVRLNAWQMSRAHQGSSPAAVRTGSQAQSNGEPASLARLSWQDRIVTPLGGHVLLYSLPRGF
jgi:hypothetical protein